MNKVIANESLFQEIIWMLALAPEDQILPELSEKCRKFIENSPPANECYDFLIYVSQQKCPYDISSFVQVLASVNKYYERP